MKYLSELVKDNGHKLVTFNEVKFGYEYKSVFDYSEEYGGTYDSHKYYNDYYVEINKIDDNKKRLEEIREAIQDENISYGEIVELQNMAQYIEDNDAELKQWAGIEE